MAALRNSKAVASILPAVSRAHYVGDGFLVKPLLGGMAFQPDISPFLMFDYAEPKMFPPTQKKLGVGFHPHRGFETITIALKGEIEHQDSEGHTGVIGTGDVQWMTAGKGIFHNEFHSRAFAKEGGLLEMMQLWVNLPKKLKMVEPRYQEVLHTDIPVIDLPDNQGHVRVIAGDYEGNKGAAETDFFDENGKSRGRGHIELWEIVLKAGAQVNLPIPEGHTTLLFVRNGKAKVADTDLGKHRIVLMTREGSSVQLSAPEEDASIFLLGGAPIVDETGQEEPIEAYGPMVMNTRAEIRDAMIWASKQQRKYY